MNKRDKIVLGILVLFALFLFFYGFRASTGYAVAVSETALDVGSLGRGFWLGVLGVLIVAFVLVRGRGRRPEKR